MSELPNNPQPAPMPESAQPQAAPENPQKPLVNYDDFAKLDLCVAKVLEVKDHPNADKLYVLTVDVGGRQRQIIAGLRPYMPPEALLGQCIIIVANLEPRKMRGLESQGMLLAASYEHGQDRKVVFLTTDTEVPAGSPIA